MIKFHELKVGNNILAEFEGKLDESVVTDLDAIDKEVCVETEVQEFWYQSEHLFPIPVDEVQLMKFHFEKQENPDGSVKYMRGPFRIFLHEKGNFSSFEIWYREDKRHINHPFSVHELQNHYLEMTKVELTRD